MLQENTVEIISFYYFKQLDNIEELQYKITAFGLRKGIKGTILLATEGINAQFSGYIPHAQEFLNYLKELFDVDFFDEKSNFDKELPFSRFKVRIKKEIIAMGIDDLNVEALKGDYIKAEEWDEFISKDNVVVVDTRNDYECSIGTFTGSINPETSSFKKFPQWVEDNKHLFENKEVGMFCTGGVRCEKSTALLKSIGVEKVYHLQGGVIRYLEVTKNQNKKWEGALFVFDDRRAVDEHLEPM
jgi:UPF0176 protein